MKKLYLKTRKGFAEATPDQIREAAKKLPDSRLSLSPADRMKAAKMLLDGKPIEKVCERFGISKPTAYRIRREAKARS